ncbi:hypothetical protein FNH22_06205 [Fulvivirga sp. M361]|uniref:hypothetical protein n=1 Tax=Fulvivirga sp. M361 TaxID=2594266 RepID=UPI00117BD7AC|nr:hypothetical protein [Fulvivirga sp. M361]TRX60635.1 hypothetical protein FNH22_06205 [Fulvivirga sp. M361]
MNTVVKIRIMLLFLLLNSFLYGQQVERIEVKDIDKSFNSQKVFTVSSDYFQNSDDGHGGSRIISSSGHHYDLSSGEKIVETIGGKILTTTPSQQSTAVRMYSLNREISNAAEIELLHKESFKILENGWVIVSDEYALFGRSVKIYSNNLVHQKILKPFGEYGFEHAEYSGNSKRIILLSSNSEKVTMITVLDLDMNVIRECKMSFNYVPSLIKSFQEGFIVYGQSNLSYINNDGDLIWSKKILLPRKDIAVSHGILSVITGDELVCLNPLSGEINWVKPIKSFYPQEKINAENLYPRPIQLKTTKGGNPTIVVVMGIAKKGTLLPRHTKYNSQIFAFNDKGHSVFSKELAPTLARIQLKVGLDGFVLIDDEKIERYEIR